jgi:Arc/MetJ-type ribon-helix-helix transcriptional regulator
MTKTKVVKKRINKRRKQARKGYGGRTSYPVTVSMTHNEHTFLKELAKTCATSHSAVVRLGLRLVLRQAQDAIARLGVEQGSDALFDALQELET